MSPAPTTVEVVYGQKERVAAFVAPMIPGCERGWVNFTAIGMAVDGRLIGGTVFHDWEPNWGAVQMSSAAVTPRWISRATLSAIFRFPFLELDCRNLVMRVSSLNTRMCGIAERLGFTGHRLPDFRAPGADDVIYLLSRKAWETGRFC